MTTVLITCLFIMVARISDVTLDTIRTVAIVQGRRYFSTILGFFEALIYIVAVAKVLQNHFNYYYAMAYALGFAAGTYLGILLDQLLAFGEQLVTVCTRKGSELLPALRGEGYRVTEFVGRGRDGQVHSLFIQITRRTTKQLTRRVRELDPNCFFFINDVRTASAATFIPGEGQRA